MDPMLDEFQAFLSQQQLSAPRTPLLSNLTGTWLTEQQVTDPATWTRQISSAIRFADELDVVLADPGRVLVEVGPGGSLTGSAIRHPKWSAAHRAVRLMRHPIQNADDRDTFLRALGELWSAGIEVDWTPRRATQPQLVSLPGYPFARQRHWVEPKHMVWSQVPAGSNGSPVGAGAGAGTVEVAQNGESQTETTLRRIWEQCMGVSSIDRNANFFDMGGDSLMAISIAMSAANEGLTITPQDLYEYPTLAALTAAVDASFAASGLAKAPVADAHPAVPPNIAYFLDRGLRDTGRWRVPLILRLDPKVGSEDVRAVLTAVANHHDALRLQLVDNAGMWEQHIAPSGNSLGFPRCHFLTTCPPAARKNGLRCRRFWPNCSQIKVIRTRRWQQCISPVRTAVRTTWGWPCTRWSATTRRVKSSDATSSPRSGSGWRARRSRWSRSPPGGGTGRFAARPSRHIPQPSTLAPTGSRIQRRRPCGWLTRTSRNRPAPRI
ncbi:hypothetical protein NIIDMKKI_50240 [Mycobacterium kansasii]|uniref:Carrier domain-containing protein n=1 Tax=Mycobacterium kansasii TaxID=1768 RepID=A0A7G1IME0_MYCKA|nr:hypothetical protein NIIDMKKI_50240 [Mycobacterium kansasii]